MERWSDKKRRSGIITERYFHIYDNFTKVWYKYLLWIRFIFCRLYIHVSSIHETFCSELCALWMGCHEHCCGLACMCCLSVASRLSHSNRREIIIVIICFADSGGWNIHYHAVDEIYIIMHYYEFVLSLNTHYHLRAKSIYWSKSIYYGVYMLLAKSTPVSHGNSHPPPPRPPEIIPYDKRPPCPPEGIPYGKPSPGRNPMAELPQGGNNTIW